MKPQNKANYNYLQREAVDQETKNWTYEIPTNKLITKALNIKQYQQMPKIIDQEFEVNLSSEVMSHYNDIFRDGPIVSRIRSQFQ